MLFTLEVLPAAEGDCLLLHWGTTAKTPKLGLVDGGPGTVYEDTLRPRLEQIRSKRQLKKLPLELAVVTHVDNDHLTGVKKLVRAVKQEVENQAAAADRHVAIKRLWYNAFNDVLGDPIDKYYNTLTASYTAGTADSPSPAMIDGLARSFQQRHALAPPAAREEAQDVARMLAGYGEGRDLRDDQQYLYQHQQTLALNSPIVDSKKHPTLITARKPATSVDVAGLDLVIVGPSAAEIEALQADFDEYIQEHHLTAEAVLAAYADRSIPNLSSIVCLVSFKEKRILLTGDARGDSIIEGLEAAGLLPTDETLTVNVLKVPHHGSGRNVAPDFFKRVIADTYVFSADGKYGNPDRETLEWLTKARGKDARFLIVLTYDVATIDANRKLDFKKNKKSWNQKRDSLEAFFAAAKADGYRFTVQAGAPARIDLGTEKLAW